MNANLKSAALAALLWLAASAAQGAAGDCSSWLPMASIERILPADSTLQIEPADGGHARQAVLFECLRAGDRLVFSPRTREVELFIAGSPRRVSMSESPFLVPDSAVQRVTAAMNALMDAWRLGSRETGAAVINARTKGQGTASVTPAKGLPTASVQRLLPGTRSVVPAWRTAQAADWGARGKCVATGVRPELGESAQGWFMILSLDANAIDGCGLSVVDDHGSSVMTLSLRTVSAPAIPAILPLGVDWRTWTPGDRIAWSVWTLQQPDMAEWHLQALTWLYEERATAWLAGHLFYRVVNGTDGGR